MVSARARARSPPGCRGAQPSITGHFWHRSVVVRERAGGRPGAQPSITGYLGIWDRSVVVRERVALPGISGLAQRLSGSALHQFFAYVCWKIGNFSAQKIYLWVC